VPPTAVAENRRNDWRRVAKGVAALLKVKKATGARVLNSKMAGSGDRVSQI